MNVIEMQAARVSPPWMPVHLPSVLIVEDERKMRERLTAQVRALDTGMRASPVAWHLEA